MGGPHKRTGRKQGQTKSTWYWSWVYEVLGTELAEKMIRDAHAVPISESKLVPGRKPKAKGASA